MMHGKDCWAIAERRPGTAVVKTLGLKTAEVSPNFQVGGESPFADLDAAASLSNGTPRRRSRRVPVMSDPILPRPCRSIE